MLIQISDAPAIVRLNVRPATDGNPAEHVSSNDQTETQELVCIVDDDAWVSDSVMVLLQTYGYEVLAFRSGKQFLEDERRLKAKCLIIDQHMPGLSGLDVLAELRRQDTRLPTILITGRLDGAIAERSNGLGVLTTLEKPFAAAQLIESVRCAVGPRC
ncbi:MAG TPA: response regulator [Stellaceae bacterium]|nr:response regulator [Stellaceae bacterium]